MTLVFPQNPTGMGYLAGPLPAGYALLGQRAPGLIDGGERRDVSVWQYVNTGHKLSGLYVACSRHFPALPRKRRISIQRHDHAGSRPRARMQVFEGADRRPGDRSRQQRSAAGDESEIALHGRGASPPDPAKKLSITTDAGATVLRASSTRRHPPWCHHPRSTTLAQPGNSSSEPLVYL